MHLFAVTGVRYGKNVGRSALDWKEFLTHIAESKW